VTTSRRRPRIGADSAHSWARNLTLGNPHAKAVLMAVCFYVNDEGSCYCGIGTLAQDTDLSENTVRSRLRWLDDIGAIVRIPQWLDDRGRRTYIVGGKRTSDEIKLLLDEDFEAIEARARGNDLPSAVATEPELSQSNPAPQVGLNDEPRPVSPAPALQQPSTSVQGLDSSELEQEDSPPTPPLGGRSKIISDDKRASFDRFAKVYPSPIVDYEATLRLWASLSDEDTEDAIKGARGYARFLGELAAQKRSRNVKDAHRWLKHRQWIGFLAGPAAKGAEASRSLVTVAEGSDDAAEWAVFDRICGRERRFVNGRTLVPTQRPPPVGDGKGEWLVAVEGSGQFAGWLRRLREGPAGVIGLRQFKIDGKWVRGLMVPAEWPPPKTIPGTLCTDEDMRELARG
jgi:hypothetical protein